MPKSSKNKSKTKTSLKLKTKRNSPSETPGITTKKSYWIMLTVVLITIFSIASYILKFDIIEIGVLMIAIVLLIGLIGYVRITPSTLSKSKRGTFLFVGASVIGFSIWAAIVFVLMSTGTLENVFGDNVFFILPSLIICLTAGAFIGELLGQNSKIQKFFFKPKDDL